MPVKFTLRDDHAPIDLFQPAVKASLESFQVEHGKPVEVVGELAKEQPYDDAYVVVNGNELRAWPKAVWNLEKPAASAAPAVKEK